eukprot:2315945-Rhodomonas_salina.1
MIQVDDGGPSGACPGDSTGKSECRAARGPGPQAGNLKLSAAASASGLPSQVGRRTRRRAV